MNEATLVSSLTHLLRKELTYSVVFKHRDESTSGMPDISVTWHGKTTWLEVKFLNPKLIDRGIQKLTMLKLAKAGSAFYVLYDNTINVTCVVQPKNLESMVAEFVCDGFDHLMVVDFIKRIHGGE